MRGCRTYFPTRRGCWHRALIQNQPLFNMGGVRLCCAVMWWQQGKKKHEMKNRANYSFRSSCHCLGVRLRISSSHAPVITPCPNLANRKQLHDARTFGLVFVSQQHIGRLQITKPYEHIKYVKKEEMQTSQELANTGLTRPNQPRVLLDKYRHIDTGQTGNG